MFGSKKDKPDQSAPTSTSEKDVSHDLPSEDAESQPAEKKRSFFQKLLWGSDEADRQAQEEAEKIALEKAKENQVDLVLSDVNMPKMDGITLISELRKIESYKLTPILVLTTESGRDMKTRGREAGATGWVVKPFQPENLVKMIDRVLQ